MSSGTEGSHSFPTVSYPSSLSNLRGRWRSWDGANGKYETATEGYPRTKWNTYLVERAYQEVPFGAAQFKCTLPGGGTDTSFAINSAQQSYIASADSLYPSDSALDANKTLSKLLDSVKGHSFNLAVNLAQMGELSSMVSSNLGRIGRSMLALRHGDFSTAARQLGVSHNTSKLKAKDISGRWLELQYGWLPSLSDTYEAAKAFHAISAGPRSSLFHAGSVKSQTGYYTNPSTGMSASRLHKRSFSYSLETFEELGFGRQLGLVDPLSVAWELIPYSFVVDWFVPIGTYLSNLNQIPKLKGRWMVTSHYETAGPVNYKWNGPFPLCGYHGGAHRYQALTIIPTTYGSYSWTSRRSIGSTPPDVPFPKFNLGGAVHGTRVWNAISLAHQRFFK